MAMSSERYEQFWLAIDVIEARQLLLDLGTVDFPHLKAAAREKHHRKLHKIAYPDFNTNKEAVTPAQIMEELTRKLGRG